MDLVALTCDTTGTLIASAYVNPKTKIAVIFGTGCNAAYMETIKEIPKLKGWGFADDAEIAINCEWVWIYFYTLKRPRWTYWHQGAFDSFKHEHLPRTKYDITVDESSNKPGEQAFEVDPPAHVIRRSLTVTSETHFGKISRRDPATCHLRFD